MNTRTIFKYQRLLVGLLFSAGLLALWLLRLPVYHFMTWVSDRQAVAAYIQQVGMWGPLALFALLVLQVFLAVIPGHALILAGGYVYGFTPGMLITLSSTVLGSQIAFLISRRFGRAVVYRLADPDHIHRWDRLANRQGTLFYFFTFVLPIFPSDLMCYVAGLGTISSLRFLIANVLGRGVCAAFITLIGSNGLQMPVVFWVSAVLGLAILYAAWRVYRHRCLFPSRRDKHENRISFSVLSAHD
jgi:uncharacterized membrane protein YdjX (TVP38/TMEM64 family)